MFVACGDITEVAVRDGKFIITAPDKTVYALLSKGKREIERALSWQGLELNVVIEEKVIVPDKFEDDKKVLSKIFSKKLTTIE